MKDALSMIIGLILICVSGIILLQSLEHGDLAPDYAALAPSQGQHVSYGVEHTVSGYKGEIYEVGTPDITEEEKQAIFDEYRRQENWEAEYQEARYIAESDSAGSFIEAEEDRILELCEEEGFAICHDIQYTCNERYDCHLVYITCDNDRYSPWKELEYGKSYDCDDWDVEIEERDFDIRDHDPSYWEHAGYQW